MKKPKSKCGKQFAIFGKKLESKWKTSFSSLFKQQIEMSFIQFLDDAFREFNELTGRDNVEDEVMYYESQIEEPKKTQHKRNVENHSISQRLSIAKIKAEQALLNLQIAVIEAEQQRAPPNVAVGIPVAVEIPSLASVTATIAPNPIINLVTESDSDDDMPISQMLVARPKTKTTHFPTPVWKNIMSYIPEPPIVLKEGDILVCYHNCRNWELTPQWNVNKVAIVVKTTAKSITYFSKFLQSKNYVGDIDKYCIEENNLRPDVFKRVKRRTQPKHRPRCTDGVDIFPREDLKRGGEYFCSSVCSTINEEYHLHTESPIPLEYTREEIFKFFKYYSSDKEWKIIKRLK